MEKTICILFVCILINKAVLGIEDCEGRIGDICYEDSKYPYKEIETIWKKKDMDKQPTFGKLLTNDKSNIEYPSDISCNLCETEKSIIIQPLSIINQNVKMYLIATNKYPRPEINVQICKSGAQCKIEQLQNDYRTECVQKYSLMTVLAFNESSQAFQKQPVSFPSACQCTILDAS